MAVKWAVANGQWNVGSTWNDGVVPVDGDVVYCNNHSITANVNIALPNTILTNEVCPTTNVSGGHLIVDGNRIITFKECYADATYIIGISGNNTCTINADIFAPIVFQSDNSMGAIYSTSSGNNKVVIINGNCYGREAYTFIGSYGNHYIKTTINGNVILKYHLWTGIYSGSSQLINGSVHIENAVQIWVGPQYGTFNLTINGDVTGGGYYTSGINGQINIGGSCYYTGVFGFSMSRQVNFLNPNAEIKYIGPEPNPNYYVILAQQELNNRQQYPPEDEVKQGTEYVWGELVGTYQQPPESVVLKDYVYDNGDKVGTLENEVTVNVGCINPQDVRKDIPLANMGIVGTMVIPAPENVLEGTIYDNGTEGTLESQSTADYPAEDKVLIGTSYDHDNMIGTLEPGGDNPQESDVRFGVPYNHNLNTGKAHIPSSQDVRKNVPIEDTVGQIVIPRTSEVKKDVEFDIDSVGTMESVIETNNTINVYRKR